MKSVVAFKDGTEVVVEYYNGSASPAGALAFAVREAEHEKGDSHAGAWLYLA